MAASNVAFLKVRPTAGGASRPDVFDRLTADHERLRVLIARLREDRDGAPDRQRLFDMLCDAVEGYGAAAEQTFYAELLTRAEGEDTWPARYAVGVHDMAELLLFELSNLDMSDEAWQTEIDQFAAYLEDHFRLEAGDIFPLAKTLLDGEQAARLGDGYAQARRQWIETFGRLPDMPQPLPAERAHGLDAAGRDRPATWFERLRRPSRAARPPHSATAR